MHHILDVEHVAEFRLRLLFEDGSRREVDLKDSLEGEVFEPLKDPRVFATARLNADVDTVTWENGADMSPDYLYEISSQIEVDASPARRVAEARVPYEVFEKVGKNGAADKGG